MGEGCCVSRCSGKFRVQRKTNTPPHLLQYSDLQEHTIPNESTTYTTASVQFNPNKYIKVDLHPLVEGIRHNATPMNSLLTEDTLDMPPETSEDLKHIKENLKPMTIYDGRFQVS